MTVVKLVSAQERARDAEREKRAKEEAENIKELTEILHGLEGRVAAGDLIGLCVIGRSRDGLNDCTVISHEMARNAPFTIGALEILKGQALRMELDRYDETDLSED